MVSDPESTILLLALGRLERWGKAIRAGKHRARSLCYKGIKYTPSRWFSDLSHADQQRLGRGRRHLEQLGLIGPFRRYGVDGRVMHFRPTPKGVEIAIRLRRRVGDPVDVDALTAALDAADWATDEHRAVLAAFCPPGAAAPQSRERDCESA